MIYEFALDPTVITNLDKFRRWVEKFGYDQGRLIANLPEAGNWKELVLYSCANEEVIKQDTIFEDLFGLETKAEVDKKFAHLRRRYDKDVSWLENAKREHSSSKPFRAVISHESLGTAPEFLVADDVRETTPYFFVPREKGILSKTAEMVACVRPLLHASKEVLFIDPYFNPDEARYSPVLRAFLRAAVDSRPLIRLEYHLAYQPNRYSAVTPRELFKKQCEQEFSRLLPDGLEMTFFRSKQFEGGYDLHPRFVLTELGGVRFDHGLSRDWSVKAKEIDVMLLDRSRHAQLWQGFRVDDAARKGRDSQFPYEYFDEVTIKAQRSQ